MNTIRITVGQNVYLIAPSSKGYIASIVTGVMGPEAIHRDHRTLEESMRIVGLHIAALEAAAVQGRSILEAVGLRA